MGFDKAGKRGAWPGSEEGRQATMMFQLPDPGISKLRDELPHENLEGMQKVLARCLVVHVTPALEGFNYQGFVQNLSGISKVELDGVKLYALLTRNNAFILANVIAEELHDLVQGLMDLQLADRITLRDGDKQRYLYKVPSEQMERLRTIANQNRLLTAKDFPFHDLLQFRRRLGSCKVQGASFDIARFAECVRVVGNLYEDLHGNQVHHLVVADRRGDLPFALYIKPRDSIPNSVVLMFGSVMLCLARD
jgi:hypothetical protein